MKRLGIVFQEKLLEHDFGPGHPVRTPERLQGFRNALQEKGLLALLQVTLLDPQREVTEEDILAVHHASLLEEIKALSIRGGSLDGDTPVPPGTYERAKLQAGGFLGGAEAILEGKLDRIAQVPAFGGHHAMYRHGTLTFGFCYFNQDAIVVRNLQRRRLIQKALILDTDCHHGNGTQDIFYQDPTVLTISLHQDPHTLYPGTMGFAEEVGEGEGRGFNVNVPLPPRTGCASYLKALMALFPPLARQFQPDIILALLTGDTHFQEPLTDFGLGLGCYGQITKLVSEVANQVCGGRLLGVVSGGRNLTIGPVIDCVITAGLAEYEGLALEDPFGAPPPEPPQVARAVSETLYKVSRLLSPYWKL